MIFQVLIHVQGVQVLAVKTGEQHIHHNGDVNLVFVGIVFVAVLLIFDAALHILIVQVKIIDIVIGVELGIVIRNDFLQGFFLLFRILLVVFLFLWQIFLNLLHVFIAFGRRRKHASDIQGNKIRIFCLFLLLNFLEQTIKLNGVIDRSSSHQRIELALIGGFVVFIENSFYHGLLCNSFTRFCLN